VTLDAKTLEERRAIAKTMYSGEQIAGSLAFFVAVALLLWRRFGAPDFTFPVAWASFTLGWALIGYAFVRRALFVRAGLNDPKA
jgi:hypothetical protein